MTKQQYISFKWYAALVMLLVVIFIRACSGDPVYAQEDTTKKPFVFNSVTGKWETSTSVVKQYIQDMNALRVYRDSIVPAQKRTIDTLKRATDSLIAALHYSDEMYDGCMENVRAKDKVIEGLLKPVELKVKDKPFIEYVGIFGNVGTYYKFDGEIPVNKDQILKQLRYFASLDIQWVVLDKIKAGLEIILPLELRAKLGIKL